MEKEGLGERFSRFFKAKFVPSEDLLKYYGHWTKPDDEAARKKYLLEHTHHEIYDVRTTPTKELKEFGLGHLLYFYFLKYMAILFTVLAFMPALGLIICNLGGAWYSTYSDLDKTTVGNFGMLNFTGNNADVNVTLPTGGRGATAQKAVALLFMSTAEEPSAPNKLHMDKANAIVACSVLDLLGVLLFFGFTLFYIHHNRKLAQAADEKIVTIHNYSIEVMELPPDTTPEELKVYFEKYGEILTLELARACHELVHLVVERGKVVHEMDEALAVVQRSAETLPKVNYSTEAEYIHAKYDLSLLNQAIKEEQEEAGAQDVVAAYITYKSEDSKAACLEALPCSWFKRWGLEPARRFRGQHALLVREAPEPSDIRYENLEFSKANRFWRRVLTVALKMLALLVGFVLINLAPAIRNKLGTSNIVPGSESCPLVCQVTDSSGNIRLEDPEMQERYRQCDATGVYGNALSCGEEAKCMECFCKMALGAGVYKYASYCSPYSKILLLNTGAQAMSVLGILLINLVVVVSIDKLTEVEAHRRRTDEARARAQALFYLQFVNTAISTIIANTYLPGVADKIKDTFMDGVIFSGIYTDLTPNWYKDVGRPLIISMFLNIFVRLLNNSLLPMLLRRWRMARRDKCLTQHALDKAYQGHEFQLANRYGEHLMMVYVTLMFSSGMPLLYWLAAISFWTSYWLEKYELLKVCRRPVAYNANLALYVNSSLPFAALWHLAWAVWTFSLFGTPQSPLISDGFKRFLSGLMNAFRKLWSGTTGYTPDQIASRVAQKDAGHLLIFLIICLAVLLVFFTFKTWSRFLGLFKAPPPGAVGGASKEAGQPGGRGLPEFPVAVRSQLLVGPTSYNIQENPQYEDAFVRMEEVDVDEALMTRVEAEAVEGMNVLRRIARRQRRRRMRNRKQKKKGRRRHGRGRRIHPEDDPMLAKAKALQDTFGYGYVAPDMAELLPGYATHHAAAAAAAAGMGPAAPAGPGGGPRAAAGLVESTMPMPGGFVPMPMAGPGAMGMPAAFPGMQGPMVPMVPLPPPPLPVDPMAAAMAPSNMWAMPAAAASGGMPPMGAPGAAGPPPVAMPVAPPAGALQGAGAPGAGAAAQAQAAAAPSWTGTGPRRRGGGKGG